MAVEYFEQLRDEVEREIMACIGCNDCLLACPLPEARVVTISELNHAVLSETITAENVIAFVDACTQCRQCVPVCPADLHRADMILWNKMKVETAQPDREILVQVGDTNTPSGWTLDQLATHLSENFKLFQGVDPAHLRRILLSVTLRRLAPGEILCREGQYHERLYVVLTGAVEQAASSTASDRTKILALGPGSFHGELAVLGNQEELFTISAVLDSLVLEFPKAAVHRLMNESTPFKTTMDGLYARRAQWTYARQSPVLAALPEAAVQELLGNTTFRVLMPGEVLYREGDDPGDLYLVRSGFLRVARKFYTDERVLQYFREGDVFGASALLFNRPQSTTVSANTRSEVFVIPGAAVRSLLDRDPSLRTGLAERALETEESLVQMGVPARLPPSGQATSQVMSLEGLLDRGVIQGHEILMIDTGICTDCNNCVDACERRHGYARLTRSGLQLGHLLFPSACRHCEDPVCLLCSVNGIVREPDGEIRIVPDNCIGCGACAERCPYDNIQMHQRKEEAPKLEFDLRKLARGPHGEEALEAPTQHEINRVAVKCDLCAGFGYYACVHACPVGAAMRIDPVAAFGRNDLLIGLEMRKEG